MQINLSYNYYICTFLWYLHIYAYLFRPKTSTVDSRKTSITQEWLVIESCPTPRWIVFLMLYRLVLYIRSHFNELILVWSAYERQAAWRINPKMAGVGGEGGGGGQFDPRLWFFQKCVFQRECGVLVLCDF